AGAELPHARPGDDGPRLHCRPRHHAGELPARVLDLGAGHPGLRRAGRAGLNRVGDEVLLVTLSRLMGDTAMLVLAAALVISAAWTMDSTFSSAAKLAVVDMGLGGGRTNAGRVAMLLFALGGLALVFVGSDDLFAAVAVSGTASLFLTPVIVYSILLDREVRPWAFQLTFVAAIGGAIVYFLENSGRITLVGDLSGLEHSYGKLLVITVAILVVGFVAFALASRRREPA